ncbi:hypothetical protein HS125_06665 [bacterium]|nr:hypothetical protein [bacterium]
MFDFLIHVSGTTVRLSTDEPSYAEYLRLHFVEDLRPHAGERAPIRVDVRWDHPRPLRPVARAAPEAAWTQLARGLATREGRLSWQPSRNLPGLTLEWDATDSALSLHARFHWARTWHEERRLLRHACHAHRTLRQLTYYTVYYPAFLWMERQGWQVLHAAGVEVAGKGLAIVGPAGCGKSSLAMALTACPNARLLSDNLLLCRDQELLAVYEPIRLTRRSHNSPSDGFSVSPLQFSSRLTTLHADLDKRATRARLGALLFPSLGPSSGINHLPWSATHARFQLAQDHASELADYRLLKCAMSVIKGDINQDSSPCGGGLTEAPSFEALLPRSRQAFEVVDKLLATVQL